MKKNLQITILISSRQSCLVGLSFQHHHFDTLSACWIMKQPIVRRFWWILKDGEPSIFKLWMNVTTKLRPICLTRAKRTCFSVHCSLVNKISKNWLERTILHSSIECSNLIGCWVFWQVMNHSTLPILLIRFWYKRKLIL